LLRFNLSPTQVLVLGFAFIIIVGALLLNLPIASKSGQSVGFLNALFTATSAVCVTGLVVVDTFDTYSLFGQIVIISLIQIGGLGIMTMATLIFLLLGKKITFKERLIIQEALNQISVAGVVRLTKFILMGTFLFELLGAFFLSFRFIPQFGLKKGIYYSLFHSISAFNNAGFDLMGGFRSLTQYVEDPIVSLTISALIVIGGLGFSVWADIYTKRCFRKLSLHTKLVIVITAFLIITGAVMFYILEYNNPATMGNLSMKGKVLSAVFHSITPRTAGFNTLSTADMTMASKFLTVILMFIGGSPGGTAGGIKTVTFGIIILAVFAVIRGKDEPEIFKKRIPNSIVYRSLGIMIISLSIVVAGLMVLSITEKADFLMILYEVVSAFGTVGLTLGLTPHLTVIGKIVIILTMYMGRVGPLTVATALAQRESSRKELLRYPEEKVMVG